MRTFKTLLFIVLCVLFCACSTYIKSSWRAQTFVPKRYTKILVVGIINDDNVALQSQIENNVINELGNLGYRGVSALDEYGPKGLASFSQEQTFLALCNDGIDAVITVILLDKAKEKQYDLVVNKHFSTSSYYYNRIWNYDKIEADLTAAPNQLTKYLWEGMLFDLHTLETQYVAQTNFFSPAAVKTEGAVYGNAIVRNMVKKRVLTSQRRYAVKPAF